MKHNYSITVGIIFTLLGTGCAHIAWEMATRRDTVIAYRDFRERFPQSSYLSQAKTREESLSFNSTKNNGTSEAYEAFLREYPDSPYAQDAQKKLELLCYNSAERANTEVAYEKFISQYPSSPYSRKAQYQLKRLRFYKDIMSVRTVKIIYSVTSKLPNGDDKGLLQRLIECAVPYGLIISTNYQSKTDAIIFLSGTIDVGSGQYGLGGTTYKVGTKFDLRVEVALNEPDGYRHHKTFTLNCIPQTVRVSIMGVDRYQAEYEARKELYSLDICLDAFLYELWGARKTNVQPHGGGLH